MRITVLICTHDRAALLARTIASLNAAERPPDAEVQLFVVANACRDATHAYLERYRRDSAARRLPLEWIAEPTPGKSNALNRALPDLDTDAVAFVDDDHRVDARYLVEIAKALSDYPDAGLICGRILPDWDGSEPRWVHDTGPYRIYPLPVPRYDHGPQPLPVGLDGPIPGGGNIIARREVIRRTGPFLTELGPVGHDLGGAEDLEWVRRALRGGALLHYVPRIVQHHYVDSERLTLSYLLRKGFQRSKSVMRFRRTDLGIPLYMWRKLAGNVFRSLFSRGADTRRFYSVRAASAAGEISGMKEAIRRRKHRARLPWTPERYALCGLGIAAIAAFGLLPALAKHWLVEALAPAGAVAGSVTLLLVAKSVRDFSQTGPRIGGDILRRYRFYVLFAMTRLGIWVAAIAAFWALPGALLAVAAGQALGLEPGLWVTTSAAALTLGAATLYATCRALVFNPGLIIASWQYRKARMLGLWRLLSAGSLRRSALAASSIGAVATALLAALLWRQGANAEAAALCAAAFGYAAVLGIALWEPEGRVRRRALPGKRPNIVLIGSDTLRADRVGALRNGGSLTPNIDRLAARGTSFTACYVPCARTAPSLISLLTGTWPHTHGVRDNFVHDEETQLALPALPETLRALGYRSAAVSDWCGADLAKFSFGFDIADVPHDQWNLKYFIRQGPKDIRLFLSLFLHNRIGRLVLPEVYFLGGVPQTTQLGRRARRTIARLATTDEPFLLNLFYSTTHPPFASEYPYYLRFADPGYAGESKFAMARLTDPFDIIRRQGDSRQEFDLDQILALYDSCVAQFDDEVGRLLELLESSGLAKNTIVVFYSDHGMEFFEHDTWGQGNSAVGDFSARVPLVIADPRLPAGQRIDGVVRSIDVAPTLLELAGAPYIHCDGVSLVAGMRDPGKLPNLKAFNETGMWITPMPSLPARHLSYPGLLDLLDVPDPGTSTLALKPEYRERVVLAKDRMVRDGRWKLVYQPLEAGMRLSLFDLAADPGCTVDLAAREPRVVAQLWSELRAWMAADPLTPLPRESETFLASQAATEPSMPRKSAA
jgi:arylsulfatase A-like enzyme/GT2 family glycosyltransferase